MDDRVLCNQQGLHFKLIKDNDSHSFISYDKGRLGFAYDDDTALLTAA
jgi:hypothetical protein